MLTAPADIFCSFCSQTIFWRQKCDDAFLFCKSICFSFVNLYFQSYFTCHSSDWSRKYVSEIASIFSTVPMSEIWKLFVIIVRNLIKGERPEIRQSRPGGCTAGRWQGRRWWGRSGWSGPSRSRASCPPGSESRWTFSKKKGGWLVGIQCACAWLSMQVVNFTCNIRTTEHKGLDIGNIFDGDCTYIGNILMQMVNILLAISGPPSAKVLVLEIQPVVFCTDVVNHVLGKRILRSIHESSRQKCWS